jgi:hypothetical protein
VQFALREHRDYTPRRGVLSIPLPASFGGESPREAIDDRLRNLPHARRAPEVTA